MCSCWDAVNNMIKLQHTQIKVSFEKSINIVEYNDPFYSKLRGFVSRNALSYIADHYDRVKTVGIDIDGSLCGCTIRITHGLPCACELAKYSRTWHPIPLQAIHVHWRTLNFSDQEMNNEGLELALQREVDALHNQFQELDYAGKITLKAKLRELAFPDAILMCPSPENYFDAPKALGFRERQIN